jgi:hypothetical protein
LSPLQTDASKAEPEVVLEPLQGDTSKTKPELASEGLLEPSPLQNDTSKAEPEIAPEGLFRNVLPAEGHFEDGAGSGVRRRLYNNAIICTEAG